MDVPAQREGAAAFPARMFYAFRAADADPERKPILLLFNGGPHSATTAGLLPFFTLPLSVDPNGPVGAPLVDNPASLTRFANLLFVDERSTGFSYGTGPVPKQCTHSSLDDAADFTRVLLDFIQRHPALAQAKVGIVGESYGGLRALEIAQLLIDPNAPEVASVGLAPLVAPWANDYGAPLATTELGGARKVAGLVLIQAYLLGARQHQTQAGLILQDPVLSQKKPDADPYDIRETGDSYTERLLPRLGAALSDRDRTKALLGADLDLVPAFLPAQRGTGARFAPTLGLALAEVSAAFDRRLGALRPEDHYFDAQSNGCGFSPEQGDDIANRGQVFVNVLRSTPWFLTNARYDSIVHTPTVPFLIAAGQGFTAEVDVAPRDGVARPGWVHVGLPADGTRPAQKVDIRFPQYESGHMVTVSAGAAFADDVRDWLVAASR